MASARKRGSRRTGLYGDAQGRQQSAGTYDNERRALKAAEHAEAAANPPEPIKVQPGTKRGKPAIAGCGPVAIVGAKLEATSRETYSHLLKHVTRDLGSTTIAQLAPATVRMFASALVPVLHCQPDRS